MEKIFDRKKFNLIFFIVAVIITSIIMTVFANYKKGWHEDEIFSYGSSNYKYDNLFQNYAEKDTINQIIDEKIIDNNIWQTLKNIGHYITHRDEFMQIFNEKRVYETPVWKTNEQAKDYVTVSNDEIFSYWSVYYNQSRDVHPPLFYMLVHFISCFFLNHFSKYIIFIINILFYIASCFVIRKIFKLLNKDDLSAITILLYGLSMGAISMVIFQRMYIMLGFFVLLYLYFNLKILKNSFEIDKSTKRWLTLIIILGFLTQYYFCIYAIFSFLIMLVILIRKKKYDALKRYIWCHIKAAIIGIIIFPASIYHIFFSYRGVGGISSDTDYLAKLQEFMDIIFYAFSIPKGWGYICLLILICLFVAKLIKSKRKDIVLIICVPIILFILTIGKIAPLINIRYISITFPIITIAIILGMFSIIDYILKYIIKNSKTLKRNINIIILLVITVTISIYGFTTSKPQFLYEKYGKRIEIAEKYQNLKLVYIGQSVFSHLQDMEEFLRYHDFIIINTWELEKLKDDKGLENDTEFILNIKCWVSDFNETLDKVLEYTNATNYELLADDGESRVYKVFKN